MSFKDVITLNFKLQINLLVFAIAAVVNRPIATIGVEPKEEMDMYATFRGSETDISWKIPNVWIGVTLSGLISELNIVHQFNLNTKFNKKAFQ